MGGKEEKTEGGREKEGENFAKCYFSLRPIKKFPTIIRINSILRQILFSTHNINSGLQYPIHIQN